MSRLRVVVVGAGVAGLTAAKALLPAFDVLVLDKGRGVGGRLATRRIGDATFDHGAQFITAHTPAFVATIEAWEQAGVVRPWFHGRVGPDGVADPNGHVRFRGVASMNAIAKHLAAGLDVRVSTKVAALEPTAAGWRILLADGTRLEANALVLTVPVPQALALLQAGLVPLADTDLAELEAICYEPCLAVLVPLQATSGLPDPGAVHPAAGPIDWMADNLVKGVSSSPAVTIHASAEFSRSRWKASDETVIAELLGAADLAHGPLPGQVQVQRWKFARPTTVHPDRCLLLAGFPPLVIAGDAFGGAKVEGAALSGAAAAEALVSILGSKGPRR